MDKFDALIKQCEAAPQNVRFAELAALCEHHFGAPRQRGSSHRVYATPWPGDPRVNIQDNNGKAKPYQVRQVLRAVKKLRAIEEAKQQQEDKRHGAQ